MYARRYAILGVAVGLGLPVVATFIEARMRYDGSLLAAQASSPLLWIIDTAPLVVGFLAVLVGMRQDVILSLEGSRATNFHRMADELSAASHALLTTVSSFSSMTAQTAAAVKETTATMTGLSQTAMRAAITAESVIGLAHQSRRSSEEGLSAVEVTAAGMAKVAEEVRGISTRIEALNGKRRDIYELTGAAGAIAERSERLAAEAAAEAAKPAPSQDGVARMARELREHAAEARSAAGRVRALLGEVHQAMMGTLTAVEAGSQRAESGATVAAGTGETIRALTATIRESSEAAREIATVAQQQDRGIDEVLKAMNEIFQAMEEGGLATQQVADEAKALSTLADALKRAAPR